MSRGLPRVLVLTGTSEYPFGRLLAALPTLVASGAAAEVRVQSREAPAAAPGVVALGMLSREALRAEVAAADAVVCHGGSGSCLEALGAGHRPVVVPRRGALGEHADDHQEDMAAELERRRLARVARDPLAETLPPAVAWAAGARGAPWAPRPLGPALRRCLERVAPRLGRRPAAPTLLRPCGLDEHEAALRALAWRSPLQSAAWAEGKALAGWRARAWVATGADGRALAALLLLARGPLAPAYAPYGPSYADEADGPPAAARLLRAAARARAGGLLWAPAWFHGQHGIVRRARGLPVAAPSRTGIVDLGRDEAALRGGMRGTWRRELERAERDPGIVLRDLEASEVASVLREVQGIARAKGFAEPLPPEAAEAFVRAAAAPSSAVRLLARTAHAGGRPLASCVAATAGRRAPTLWVAGSGDERAPGAGRLALWSVVREARALGARAYDLAGIDDQGNPGVASFKRGVGPRLAEVPGLRWLPPAWLPPTLAPAAAALGRAALARAAARGVGRRS